MVKKPRLKDFEGQGIEVKYRSKVGYLNNISGKLTFVGKEYIIVIGQMEHTIKRSSIETWNITKYFDKTSKLNQTKKR